MSDDSTISPELVLSGALQVVHGAPPVDEGVADLVDEHLERAARGNVCVTAKGGTERATIKPTIKDFGDASKLDVADALNAIAWAHCQREGVAARYCVQIFERGESGRINQNPVRAYFNLNPDAAAEEQYTDTDKPSPSYVRELERVNIRTLGMLQSSSNAVLRRDAQMHADRINSVAAEGANKVALARVEVEKLEAIAAGERKGKIFNAAASMLPAVATKALSQWGVLEESKGGDASLPPGARIESYLDAKELAAFVGAVGDERWERLKEAKTIAEAREILSGLGNAEISAAVKSGLPAEKLTEIASWEDAPQEASAEEVAS